MSRLPVPLRSVLRDEQDETAMNRVWRGIQRRRAERARRGPWIQWTVGMAAAAAVLALFFWWKDARRDVPAFPGPLRLADGAEVAALSGQGDAPREYAFADGSRVVLDPGARVEVLDNGAGSFATLLAAGRATYDVRPGGPRRWSIECGLMTVEVVGTRFTVERDPASARVRVERGTVLVRGERVRDRVQRVTSGESLEVTEGASLLTPPVPPPDPGATPAAPSPLDTAPRPATRASVSAAASVPVVPSAPSAANLPPTAPNAAWRSFAREGDNADAYAALGPAGIASATQVASVDDLLTLADVARLSGHPGDAVAPLTRVLDEHAGDARAPIAAFTLGRIELDALGQPSRAADAFARAVALGLPQSLREDAYARLVEARARAGDRAGAQGAAREYEQRFPQGKRLDEVRRWTRAD